MSLEGLPVPSPLSSVSCFWKILFLQTMFCLTMDPESIEPDRGLHPLKPSAQMKPSSFKLLSGHLVTLLMLLQFLVPFPVAVVKQQKQVTWLIVTVVTGHTGKPEAGAPRQGRSREGWIPSLAHFLLFIQWKMHPREWCHPEWTPLPTPINVVKISPTGTARGLSPQ